MQLDRQSRPVVPHDTLARLPKVEGMTGCRKSTIYKLIGEGKFPKPVRLGTRMVAWSEAAVLQWVQDRIAESQGGTA